MNSTIYHYNDILYTVFYTVTKGITTIENMLNSWRIGDKFTLTINNRSISINDNQAICGFFPLTINFLIEKNIKKKTMKIIEENNSYNIYLLVDDNYEQNHDYYVNFIL